MVITSRMHKALAFIALALVLAMLIETTVALAGRSTPSHLTVAHVGAPATQQHHDPYDGGYRAASGQLLWHETHVNATVVACVRLSRAQRAIALDELDTYVMDGANGRFVGGQYVARLIAEKLGDVPAC